MKLFSFFFFFFLVGCASGAPAPVQMDAPPVASPTPIVWHNDVPDENVDYAVVLSAAPLAFAEPTPVGEVVLVGLTAYIFVETTYPQLADFVVTGRTELQQLLSALHSGWTPAPVQVDEGIVYIPSSPDHHVEHNVVPGTPQWEMANEAVSVFGGGPGFDPDRVKCFLYKIGDAVTRVAIWVYDPHAGGVSVKGDLVWWHARTPSGWTRVGRRIRTKVLGCTP